MKIVKTFEGFLKNSYNFIKLVNLLRNWQSKYQPEDYDRVISSAFELIDDYELETGKLSPPFTLPNEQLGTEFITKFFKTRKNLGS